MNLPRPRSATERPAGRRKARPVSGGGETPSRPAAPPATAQAGHAGGTAPGAGLRPEELPEDFIPEHAMVALAILCRALRSSLVDRGYGLAVAAEIAEGQAVVAERNARRRYCGLPLEGVADLDDELASLLARARDGRRASNLGRPIG